MPWNSQNGGGPWQSGGGGGGGRGPWGQGPQGPGGGGQRPQPPNLEDLLKRSQDRFRKAMPGNRGLGFGGFVFALLIVAAIWMFSGVYRVNPSEVGVVTRFGDFVRQEAPGLRWHLPWPVESVQKPNVTEERRVNIGFRPAGDDKRPVPEESLMITGDSNIVDIKYVVLWVVAPEADAAAKFLFNVEHPNSDPNETVKQVAEAAMRQVAGRSSLEQLQETQRAELQVEVRSLMQSVLDGYDAGIRVNQVNFEDVDPPPAVIDAFRDVQAAEQDKQRFQNEAEAYANRIIPEAEGRAARIREEAEAYKERVIAEAQGEAQRFLSVYEQYANAKDVTRRRLYYETMEEIMRNMDKVLIDSQGQGGQGVVPYLPLNELQRRRTNGSGNANAPGASSGGQQ